MTPSKPPGRLNKGTLTLFAGWLASLAVPAAAQSTNQAAPPPTQDTLVLSPFTVTSDKDHGYVATSSLAGTRIKSELKDIANSITVATKELMTDLNATDATGLLVYLGNTEAGGAAGNFSAANFNPEVVEQIGFRNPQAATRIRGLTSADLTRDYFPTAIGFDSYNTERVEVNRGPNATLFGLGSPGGIINNQTIQPRLQKNASVVDFSFATFGSMRSTLDVERTLIPDRLGFRVAAVWDDQKFQQNFAYERDERTFISARYKPFNNANLSASFEKGKITANRPRANSPRDNLTRWWDPAFNKITHNPANVDFNSLNRDLLRAPGEWFAHPGFVYESPDAETPARLMFAWNLLTGRGLTQTAPVSPAFNANMVSITKGSQWFSSATAAATGIQHGSFYIDDEIGDTSIFDWRNQLLDGPNKREWEDFDVLNLSYDQTWRHPLGNVGFELAYNREDFGQSWYALLGEARGYQINIDLNTTLPWGAPNPNFGRPFIASNGERTDYNYDRTTGRLTGFLELNFTRLDKGPWKWLGRHNLTGFYNSYQLDGSLYNGRNRAGLPWVNFVRRKTSTPNLLNSSDGDLRNIVYLGSSLANLASPQDITLQGLQTVLNPEQTVTGWAWNQDTLSFTNIQSPGLSVLNDRTFEGIISLASLSRQEIKTFAVVDQVHLLPGEWLVGTVGWRRDEVEDFRRNMTTADRNEYGMLNRTNPTWVLPTAPGSIFKEDILSYGIVAHAPKFLRIPPSMSLSAHYNTAENFQPADARIDIFGNAVKPPSGTTDDRGFSISMFDERLQARFNWFETASTGASMAYPVALIETDARIVRYNTPAALAAAGWKGPSSNLKALVNWREIASSSAVSGVDVLYSRPGNMQDTQSTASKGFELDLTYNPTRNWRFAVNASQQRASRSNIAPATQEYLALRIDEWLTGATSNLLSDESGQPVKTRIYDTLLNSLNGQLAREGQNVSELREWRANIVTNYQFSTDSRLAGWSVGGAVRWQDKAAIGYPIVFRDFDGRNLAVPDLANPYYGPAETGVDMWVGYTCKIMKGKARLRFQMNIRNLLDNDKFVPVAAQPDGSIVSWLAPVGRTVNFRTAFEF